MHGDAVTWTGPGVFLAALNRPVEFAKRETVRFSFLGWYIVSASLRSHEKQTTIVNNESKRKYQNQITQVTKKKNKNQQQFKAIRIFMSSFPHGMCSVHPTDLLSTQNGITYSLQLLCASHMHIVGMWLCMVGISAISLPIPNQKHESFDCFSTLFRMYSLYGCRTEPKKKQAHTMFRITWPHSIKVLHFVHKSNLFTVPMLSMRHKKCQRKSGCNEKKKRARNWYNKVFSNMANLYC